MRILGQELAPAAALPCSLRLQIADLPQALALQGRFPLTVRGSVGFGFDHPGLNLAWLAGGSRAGPCSRSPTIWTWCDAAAIRCPGSTAGCAAAAARISPSAPNGCWSCRDRMWCRGATHTATQICSRRDASPSHPGHGLVMWGALIMEQPPARPGADGCARRGGASEAEGQELGAAGGVAVHQGTKADLVGDA